MPPGTDWMDYSDELYCGPKTKFLGALKDRSCQDCCWTMRVPAAPASDSASRTHAHARTPTRTHTHGAHQPHGRVSRFRVAPHDACGVRRGRAASAAGAQVTSGLDASGQTRFPRSVTGLARPTPAVHPRGRGGRGPGHRPADDTSSRPSRARSSGRDLGARPPSPASRLPLPVDSRVTSGAEGYFRFRRRDPSRGSRKGSRKGPRGRPLFQCSEHEVTAFGLASFLWALLLSKGRPWLVGGTATMSDVRAATDQLLNVKLQEGQGSLHGSEGDSRNEPDGLPVTIGATVPTGFEQTAADEVREKLGSSCRISKDRGKIYFGVSVESLAQVHCLRSVDNLFVVVQEFNNYQFKETKEEVLKDFEQLAEKLPWSDPLKVWKMNTSFKKKKTKRKKISQNSSKEKTDNGQGDKVDEKDIKKEATGNVLDSHILDYYENPAIKEEIATLVGDDLASCRDDSDESLKGESSPGVLKFRVTCNRAGEKHCFTSNEAARDFGGSVQDHFKWKADMTNFDVEVLLNIHDSEVIVGIALTEESLHRRNITHFGPTTLRSTLAYGMLRLCAPQPTDIIVDPMCGTGAIPIEGATEWSNCYHLAGDNNPLAVNRAANNISSLLTKNQTKESRLSCGLPIDAIQWDICNLPLRTGSVDIIVTDMPFGKRMGSKKKNWNLYPACLREMSRVCRPGTGRAVLLTQDKKCFAKALSGMGHVWRKVHTVWVNIGGLHAAVYLLKRTPQAFVAPSEQDGDRTPW